MTGSIVLVASPCHWTTRALEAALRPAGYATIRISEVGTLARLCAAGSADAVVIDDRLAPKGTSAAQLVRDVVLASSVDDPLVPILLLARSPQSPDEQEQGFRAGMWGVVPFPLGTCVWVQQLGVWTRAGRQRRERLERGLVDPSTGLYNAPGLERRAREIDGVMARLGGTLACAMFIVGGAQTDPHLPATAVADACRRVGRVSDVFGRAGDDTFAVIAPGADALTVRTLLARVRGDLEAEYGGGASFRVGICAVDDARQAMLSTSGMLTMAAARL